MRGSQSFSIIQILGLCFLALSSRVCAWPGYPTPFDDQHLIIMRPGGYQDAAGKPVKPVRAAGTVFGNADTLKASLRRTFTVHYPGNYILWIRVARGRKPVLIELRSGRKTLLTGKANEGRGSPERGGPSGYQKYADEAITRGPDGIARGGVENLTAEADDEDIEELEAELMDSLEPGRKEKWIHMLRIEKVEDRTPYYWWKAGRTELPPGNYELRLSGGPCLIDMVFLATYKDLLYPFADDVAPPPGSYIRFRIDKVPRGGVRLGGGFRIHYAPWSSGRGNFNPGGFSAKKSEPHTKTGFSPWYRLQDIEKSPGFGGSEAHLLLGISKGAAGLTQFAVFPHQDQVLREIDWNEPEGRHISMVMDFKKHLHRLRTFRDHARENYEKALMATKGKLYPLTRGELYLGNAWGYANGIPADYMVKTLRLLGFNCVSNSYDSVNNRRRYGWSSHAGAYWPPGWLPFDEEATRKRYDAHYRKVFATNREFMAGVTVYQCADEPGEIAREAMSSPCWRWRPDKKNKKTGIWVDPTGNSDLNTRKTDYRDCVLEGKVMKYGGTFGFKVATNHSTKPTQYGFFVIGKVAYDRTLNIAMGKSGGAGHPAKRAGAAIGSRPTPFKIIYEDGNATLFLNGRLITKMTALAKKGGFGFYGPSKGIAELRIRPLGRGEGGAQLAGVDALDNGDAELDLDLDDLEEKKTPDWAKPKPLKRFVEEDWVVAGGMPEAHAAFREWAREQGLTPKFFGRKSWADVRMLTVKSLMENDFDRRLFYWSRRYSGYLTPRMFSLACEGMRKGAPNKKMVAFVALSGHSLYMRERSQPLDTFQLASYGWPTMGGVSDWMSMGGWRWDSHQAVAFSVAPFNAGARVYGGMPKGFPMMHCVWPSQFRAYTMLANNVRYVSYYNYGPYYMVTEGHWSDGFGGYWTANLTNNRAAQVDDILANSQMRHARVAMLYSMANEYWSPNPAFSDKRAAFLGMSHEYYQPELITEDQINEEALKHYDALYILDPVVSAPAQNRIEKWLKAGGLLWVCADAMRRNEFNLPADLPAKLGLKRTFNQDKCDTMMKPIKGETDFRPHNCPRGGMASKVKWPGARVRARYGDGRAAWLEKAIGKGRLVYIAHRCGHSYTWKAARFGGAPVIWADTGREPLVQPLKDAGVDRELILSQPCIMAAPMSSDAGTVIILYNMQGAPATDLKISLKEPRKPVSVQIFDHMKLVDLPYEYRDGRINMRLNQFNGGQMILVRNRPAPKDNRFEEMKANASRMLASKDWNDVSAGAWFAGFFPDWRLAAKVTPLLQHKHFAVRRGAAEAIGRLGYTKAATALVKSIAGEEDSHALGDKLYALAQLNDKRYPETALTFAGHKRAFVRRQVQLGAQLFLKHQKAQGALNRRLKQFGLKLYRLAEQDPDARVNGQAIPLLEIVQPERCLAMLEASYQADGSARHRGALLKAVAGSPALLEAYLKDLPASLKPFLDLAGHAYDKRVNAMLLKRFDEILKAEPHTLFRLLAWRRDPKLTRKLWANREKLPKQYTYRITLVMERTFNARQGSAISGWTKWFKEHPER